MTKIDPFNLPDDFEDKGEEAECPSCGVIPSLDGPSPGCSDPNGCAVGRDIDPDLDDNTDEGGKEEEEDDGFDDDDEFEDEEVEELDFE